MRYTPVGRPESHRRDLVVVAVLAIGGWLLSGLSAPHTLALASTIRSTILSPFVKMHRVFALRSDLAGRVVRLETERDELARRVLRDVDLRAENARLRELLGLRAQAPGEYVVAEVVPGQPAVGDVHTFILRAGRARGLVAPAAVTVPEGLVGVVRLLEEARGYGEFWTHPEFRVSVRTEAGQAIGIIRSWQTGSGLIMRLEGVPYQSEIEPGARLVTTGVAGIYPAGIPVGTVRTEADSKSGWSRSYEVEPAVRPEGISFAFAWKRSASLDRGRAGNADAGGVSGDVGR